MGAQGTMVQVDPDWSWMDPKLNVSSWVEKPKMWCFNLGISNVSFWLKCFEVSVSDILRNFLFQHGDRTTEVTGEFTWEEGSNVSCRGVWNEGRARNWCGRCGSKSVERNGVGERGTTVWSRKGLQYKEVAFPFLRVNNYKEEYLPTAVA